jgi:hypothetical protein
MQPGDDEGEVSGKLRLFDEAESLCRIADALHVSEPSLEN